MMEGKINYDELSENQRQFDGDFLYQYNIPPIPQLRRPYKEVINNGIKCSKKALRIFIFMIFGNCYFFLIEIENLEIIDNEFFLIFIIIMYIILFLCAIIYGKN